MGECQRAVHGLHQEWLVIALGVGAGGAVPRVADAVISGKGAHRRRGEHVGHEAGVLVQANATAVADRDARSLLPAMLQGEQPEEHGLGNTLAVRRGHSEHPTLLVGDVGV